MIRNPIALLAGICFVLFLLFVVTQILIPLLTESAVFPMFSRKRSIRGKIAATNEQVEEAELIAELRTRQKHLETLVKEEEPGKTDSVNGNATRSKSRNNKRN